MNYELHPLCTLFPRLGDAEFAALVADISANGLREPITLHDGMILDGGNRYRACVAAGVAPTFTPFSGGSIVSFVLSANLHRRHLSAGQQAAIVASAQDWARAQTVGKPKSSNDGRLETIEQRAAISGASRNTQQAADKVAKADPELAKQVAHGEISLPQAVKQITPPKPAAEPKLTPAPEPEDFGPDESELASLAAMEADDRALIDKLMAADDKLAAAVAECKRLAAELAVVKGQRDRFMNQANEFARQIKLLKREAKRAA